MIELIQPMLVLKDTAKHSLIVSEEQECRETTGVNGSLSKPKNVMVSVCLGIP